MQTRHRAKQERQEKRKFPNKPPLYDSTTTADLLFVGSLLVTGAFLKPKNSKAEKAEISVPAKEITHPTIKSAMTNPLVGIAIVMVAVGMCCKYKMLNKYESFRNQN